jgi:chromosomal replication initiation ATPase DnaA
MIGRSRWAIRRKVNILGLPLPQGRIRSKRRATSFAHHDIIAEAFALGTNIKQVAKSLDIHPRVVGRAYTELCAQRQANAQPAPAFTGWIGAKEMAVIVAPVCGVSPRAIFGEARFRPAVLARIAIARALRDRGTSLTVIARTMHRSDHTTVINLLRKFSTYSQAYPALAEAYAAIKNAERVAAERRAA